MSHRKVVEQKVQGQLDFVESSSLLTCKDLEIGQIHWSKSQMTADYQTPLKQAG